LVLLDALVEGVHRGGHALEAVKGLEAEAEAEHETVVVVALSFGFFGHYGVLVAQVCLNRLP
jgi:hypothetical protein